MDSLNGGLLVEGVKGGCSGIMLPQENATEPLGKHRHSSTENAQTTVNRGTQSDGDIWKRREMTSVCVCVCAVCAVAAKTTKCSGRNKNPFLFCFTCQTIRIITRMKDEKKDNYYL